MKQLTGFADSSAYRGGFVAIGNFDGVHRGHQRMIAALVAHARREHVPAVVLTFDPPPVEILHPDRVPPRLSTLEQKLRLLAGLGVDTAIVYPTNRDFLNLTPREFFDQIVQHELHARGLVEGPNFYFGKDRAGDVGVLRDLCDRAGLSLDVVPPVTVGGRLVSSSAIRRAVATGDMSAAAAMLGRPHAVRGTVTEGAGRGRGLGFPTANLAGVETLLPPDGVYAGRAELDERRYPAAISLGPNPTFGDDRRKLEVHVLDFAGTLYGRTLDLEFLDRLRDIRAFAGADDLRAQVEHDLDQARAAVDRYEQALP
ncbi:MAG TPA: bifunctional riboflavin kinase/FAD synthetase [Planctomycetaceae bacterium]|nr:bifunctional riboflavin kinase/FAD synthetase [Planctomycetaceae bacterium]